jgi:hypothetical protein
MRRLLAELKPESSKPESRVFGSLNPAWLSWSSIEQCKRLG